MKIHAGYLPVDVFETVRLAQVIEEQGYDSIWLADQTFFRDPFVALAAVAQATKHIEIGLGVTTPYARHPVQIARAIASVDELSGGRTMLGLGAGNKKMFLDKLGIPQKRAAARIRQSITVIRKLLAGETVSWQDDDLVMEDVALEFAARADMPIYIASRAPIMLSVGGEVADGVIAEALFTAGGMQYVNERIQNGADSAGRKTELVDTVFWQVVNVTDDRATAIEELLSWTAHIIGASSEQIIAHMGIEPELGAKIQTTYRQEGPDVAAQYVTETEVDAIAIVGDADQCAEKVQKIADAGADAFAILVRGPVAEKERVFRRFAEQVLPQIKNSV